VKHFSAILAALLLTLPAAIGATESTPRRFQHFITRQGDKLYDGDKEFRFIGANMPGLVVPYDWTLFLPERMNLPRPWEQEDGFETLALARRTLEFVERSRPCPELAARLTELEQRADALAGGEERGSLRHALRQFFLYEMPKQIVGTAPVGEDGSVAFRAPAGQPQPVQWPERFIKPEVLQPRGQSLKFVLPADLAPGVIALRVRSGDPFRPRGC
jgi:hypothetical protein